MLRRITYNSVNWVDGMKITKDHFIQQEDNIFDHIRDANAIRLNDFNYGILQAHPESDGGSLKYNMIIDRNGLLKIDIYECRAVTPAGTRIEISASNAYSEQKSLSAEAKLNEIGSTNFFVVVSSNPFDRQAVGQPDVNENPPRLPFTIPSYRIQIVPVENYNKITSGPFHVAIAKIRYSGTKEYVKDDEYIPPAATLQSNADLVDIHGQLDEFLCRMEAFAVQIIKKIYKSRQDNETAKAALYLCEQIMSFLGANIPYFRFIVAQQSPVYMVEFFMRFSRVIKNGIDVKEGTGKEQMLTYFKDWIIEMKQGEFEAVIETLMNSSYQHADINQNIRDIEHFVKTVNVCFDKLSKLDYIGERKKGIDPIVTTREAKPPPPNKKGNRFLMDD